MFTVEVRDHIMIAHSFKGEVFGPAQALHCATFVVDAAFLAQELDQNGIVVDIGRAHAVLRSVLGPLNYRNLDELPEFSGRKVTTEFLTTNICDHLAEAARAGTLGRRGRTQHRIALEEIKCVQPASELAGSTVPVRES